MTNKSFTLFILSTVVTAVTVVACMRPRQVAASSWVDVYQDTGRGVTCYYIHSSGQYAAISCIKTGVQ